MKVTPRTTPAVDSFLEEDGNEDVGQEEADEEAAPQLTPLEAIAAQFPDAPGAQTIERWKASFGAVHAFVPDGESVFFIRPLRRIEHKNIGRDVRQLSRSQSAAEDPSLVEEQLHEKVVTMCLLYPQVTADFLTMSPAGLMPTLFNLVMEHSKFMSPDSAADRCYKL